VSYDEAAADWYDAVYTPMVEVIREQKVLKEFPGRTEADLVAYVLRYRDQLRQEWAAGPLAPEPGLMDAVASDVRDGTESPRKRAEEFVHRARHDWWGRLTAWFKRRVLGWEILDDRSKKDGS
jgi:hypothetical protein